MILFSNRLAHNILHWSKYKTKPMPIIILGLLNSKSMIVILNGRAYNIQYWSKYRSKSMSITILQFIKLY